MFKAVRWGLTADACWTEAGRHLGDDLASRGRHMELEHLAERARKVAIWYGRKAQHGE